MSLDAHLESLGLPKEYVFNISEEFPITVDYVNEQYLVFSKEDEENVPDPPYILSPEQVLILSQYDHAKVRKMKEDDSLFDDSAFKPSCSLETPTTDRQKAKQIALGRKAKQLKRKINGHNAGAKKLKVTKEDLMGIEVTEEEITDVLNEISTKDEKEENEMLSINFPFCYNREDFYEYIDRLSLPLPNTKEFRIKYLVVHDLWRRGFYLTTGMRFGCHYLAYEGIPGDVHARFMVECVDVETNLSPLKMISLTRVATQVKKTVLLAFVADNTHIPHYMTLQWFKPYDS